jgi:hypothetical protein
LASKLVSFLTVDAGMPGPLSETTIESLSTVTSISGATPARGQRAGRQRARRGRAKNELTKQIGHPAGLWPLVARGGERLALEGVFPDIAAFSR